MGRGEAEQFCFEAVKHFLFSDEICYVCSIEDEHLLKKAFQAAHPNSNPSHFPDFLFEGGFIEHFEVTSSHSNRRGSAMAREKSELRREADAKELVLSERMDKEPCYEGETLITDKWHSKHSYDDFCLSFQRSWQHHIESLDKYSGDKTVSIFMMQYSDLALVMDAIYPDVKLGLFYGDLCDRPEYRGYRLTHDSKMLEYIYQFRDKIKFMAFFNRDGIHGDRCEIICVENIPEILKIVKGKYRFHCATVGSAHTVFAISTPNPICKGGNDNDQT